MTNLEMRSMPDHHPHTAPDKHHDQRHIPIYPICDARLPLELGWPRDSVRHLVPVFRGGYAWEKEVALAEAAGIPSVNLWAFDHVCIFGWPPVSGPNGRAMQI